MEFRQSPFSVQADYWNDVAEIKLIKVVKRCVKEDDTHSVSRKNWGFSDEIRGADCVQRDTKFFIKPEAIDCQPHLVVRVSADLICQAVITRRERADEGAFGDIGFFSRRRKRHEFA